MEDFEVKENIRLLSEKVGKIHLKAHSENRMLSAQETGFIIECETEINELRKQLPANSPLSLEKNNSFGFGGQNMATGQAAAPTGRDYRSMFNLGRSLDNAGFGSFNEFLTVLSSGKFDNRLIQAAANETTPSSGGFSVPEQFSAWLLDSSLESEIVRPRATVWPMKSDTLKVPGWDSATHSSSLFGGLTGTWLAELGAATEVYAKMRQIQLNAKKLACYTAASNELVADGVDYERQIQMALVKTLGWYLDYAFIQGSGAGQPFWVFSMTRP